MWIFSLETEQYCKSEYFINTGVSQVTKYLKKLSQKSNVFTGIMWLENLQETMNQVDVMCCT